MLLNENQASMLKQAVDTLSEFVRIYGDDDSEILLEKIYSQVFKKQKPPKDIFIKLSFSDFNSANIYEKFWRTEKLVETTDDGRKIVLLKISNDYSHLGKNYYESLFFAANEISDEEVFDDLDDMLKSALLMIKKGAIFMGAL